MTSSYWWYDNNDSGTFNSVYNTGVQNQRDEDKLQAWINNQFGACPYKWHDKKNNQIIVFPNSRLMDLVKTKSTYQDRLNAIHQRTSEREELIDLDIGNNYGYDLDSEVYSYSASASASASNGAYNMMQQQTSRSHSFSAVSQPYKPYAVFRYTGVYPKHTIKASKVPPNNSKNLPVDFKSFDILSDTGSTAHVLKGSTVENEIGWKDYKTNNIGTSRVSGINGGYVSYYNIPLFIQIGSLKPFSITALVNENANENLFGRNNGINRYVTLFLPNTIIYVEPTYLNMAIQ